MEIEDSWGDLRRFTAARIALGRAGGSVPTAPLLDFRLAHARARDAVLCRFEPDALAARCRALTARVCVVASQAGDRAAYLRRPDLGRRLSAESTAALAAEEGDTPDLALILSDGLSAVAVMQHALPLLGELLPLLARDGWTLAPLVIVPFGRVAIQDEIGAALRSRLSLMLLGERPGLASPDSLGAYFTHTPRPGRTDAERNCVSNIRPQGLPPVAAARKLHALLTESRRLGISGVALKDDDLLIASSPDAAHALSDMSSGCGVDSVP